MTGMDRPHARASFELPSKGEAALARRGTTGAFLALAALFLLAQIGSFPIVLWDESRLAVNALEMADTGFSPVTTYNFLPDLWNTKPPLLIWLQAAMIHLIGVSETAIRIPGAIAALATLALVLAFSGRFAQRAWTPFVACLLLGLSRLFYGQHGAATGDYDALLTFFTTAYLIVLFDIVHRERPQRWRIWLAALLVLGAMMTKGVAGLVPGAGVAVYLVLNGRLKRPFIRPDYLLAGLCTLGAFAAFLAWREATLPGYVAAVWQNEVAGRYFGVAEGHAHPFPYYIWRALGRFDFSIGPLALAALAGPFVSRGRARVAIAYSLVVAAVFVLVISFSATKITWYALPAYPFAAVALALTFERIWDDAGLTWKRVAGGLLAIAMSLALGRAIYTRHYTWPQADQGFVQDYGRTFEVVRLHGFDTVHAIDAGVTNNTGIPVYVPVLRFYALAERRRGLRVIHHASLDQAPTLPGTVVASCDEEPARVALVAAAGRALPGIPRHCAAVVLDGGRGP